MKITPKQPRGHALGWCLHRGWQVAEPAGFRVAFFVRAVFRITPGETAALATAAFIVPSGDTPFDDASHGLRYPSDFVPRKPCGEVIVVGTAHPPAGLAVTRYPVRVAVGSWWKEIVVHGERSWDTSGFFDKPGPSAIAAPVPLSLARAFGGASVATNPLGFGVTGEAVPNLELANRPVAGRRLDGDPAGFGPIPPDWPQRRQHAGMPGKAVAASWWPWSPPQFDERFWMATLPDQWVEGYFRGDEPVELVHLHPERPEWRTELPGLRARVFVLRVPADAPLSSARRGKLSDAGATFEEVPLVLDTVFIDADAAEMTLVWRGSTPVRSPKLLDILGVSFGLESLGADRDPEHYLRALLADENEAAEPVPDGTAIKAEIEAAIAAGEAERTRIVAKIEAKMAEARDLMKGVMDDAKAAQAGARSGLPAEFSTAEIDEARAAAATIEAMLYDDAPAPASIPLSRIGDEVAAMTRSLQTVPLAAVRDIPEAASLEQQFAGQVAPLEEMNRLASEAAQFKQAFEQRTSAVRADIESAFPDGFLVDRVIKPGDPLDLEMIRHDGLADYDLRGVDFSGLDLGGVSFRGAIAAGASFRQARLAEADFTGTDLTGADLTGADLSGATLERTDLSEAVVAGTRFTNARLGGANLRGLALTGADFTGVSGQYADFSGATLSKAVFREAQLDQPDFTGTLAAGADFSGAAMPKADFGGAVCHDAIFDGASLANLRAREAADFTGARLHRLQADDASWTTSILDRADFQDADLRRADFSECTLDSANFDRCDLANAVFADSQIHATALTNANLFRASFDRSTLVEVRFDGSSLFEAGFWEASLRGVSFDRCDVSRATLDSATRV
jgi:uncharacterized protein YjbI with pentapeptide repeats